MTRLTIAASAIAVSALLLTGCTGGASAPGDDETLRIPFSFSMQQPDPDIFFQAEGLNVTMAAYEGLLRHVPNAETPEIEPWLATGYEVSDDGLAYTFQLREGVVFHDGTPFDAEAVKFSFERRASIGAGPSESLFAFDSVEVVDPLTAVVHLTQPSTEFIPFLASSYGQKMVSPGVLEHEVDGDLGQEWLKTNSDGTGAYTISDFTSQRYELTAFEDYWGEAPGFPTIEITIEPNFTSQVLQLESGSLDVMTHGIPSADLERLENAGFTVTEAPTFNRSSLFLNPAAPALASAEGRLAIAAAIDRDAIAAQVYGDHATVASQMFPAGLLPDGTGEFTVTFDAAAAAGYVETLPEADRAIDLAYLSDDPDNQQVAQLLQVQLQAAGLQVTSRAMTQPESFELPGNPEARPDILLVGGKASDAAHPDPFARLFYYHDAPLAYFQPQEALDADELVDAGRQASTLDEALEIYGRAADAYAASGLFIPLTDRPEIIVTRAGITGVEHEFNAVSSIRLASLRPE